jgi:hypothetical protein
MRGRGSGGAGGCARGKRWIRSSRLTGAAMAAVARGVQREQRRRQALVKHDCGGSVVAPTWKAELRLAVRRR